MWCYFLFQRNNVLTGIAVFGEREVLSSSYTLLDRTFDTCMLFLFSILLSHIECYIYSIQLLIFNCIGHTINKKLSYCRGTT